MSSPPDYIVGPIQREYPRLVRDRPRGSCLCETCVAHHEIMQRAAARDIRSDYEFYLTKTGRVRAGCRNMTIAEYRAHVAAEYPNTPKAAATLAILNDFQYELASYRRGLREKAKKAKARKAPAKKARSKK